MPVAREMRLQSKPPHRLWPYVASHPTRQLNRIAVQRKPWQTPFEMVHGQISPFSHFNIIGSVSCVLINNKSERPARMKLNAKAITEWLVGLDAADISKSGFHDSNVLSDHGTCEATRRSCTIYNSTQILPRRD